MKPALPPSRADIFAALAARMRTLPARMAKSLAVYAVLGGATLFTLAVMAYRLSPGGGGWRGTALLVGGAALVVAATVVGCVCGAVFGVTSPLLGAAREVEVALRAALAPLLSTASSSVFGGRRAMSVEELDRALERRVGEMLGLNAASTPGSGRGRGIVRHAANLARTRIVREVARRARHEGGGMIEPAMVAAVATSTIVDAAAGALTARVRVVQWIAVAVAALLALALAAIVMRAGSA